MSLKLQIPWKVGPSKQKTGGKKTLTYKMSYLKAYQLYLSWANK